MTFPAGYSIYDKMIIDHAFVGSGGMSNQDIWIPRTLLSATAQSTLRSDGGDARFTLGDGATRLAVHAVLNSAGVCIGFRFNLPVLSDSADTIVRLYYNGTDVAEAVDSPYGQYATYDSYIKGYWPLNQDPSGDAPQMLDMTSSANHGTAAAGMVSGDSVAGKVGNAIDVVAAEYVTVPNALSLNPGLSHFWYEGWIKCSDVTNYPAIISKTSAWYQSGSSVVLEQTTGKLRPNIDGDGGNQSFAASPNLADNAWHYFVVLFDRSAFGTVYGWIDGVSVGSYTSGETTTDMTNSRPLVLGTAANYTADQFTGQLNEIRLGIGGLIDDAYVATKYANANDPSVFYKSIIAVGANHFWHKHHAQRRR